MSYRACGQLTDMAWLLTADAMDEHRLACVNCQPVLTGLYPTSPTTPRCTQGRHPT